jgi:hypothetical protein
LALIIVGCGGPAPVNIVAIDASGSAQEFHDTFVRVARDVNESTPGDGVFELYRFDTLVHELHVGGMLGDREFRDKMQSALEDRGQKGTSLLTLARRLDERLPLYAGKSIRLTICTDCGVEGMADEDHFLLQKLTKKWAETYPELQVSFIGLRKRHYDPVRHDFAALEARMSIR